MTSPPPLRDDDAPPRSLPEDPPPVHGTERDALPSPPPVTAPVASHRPPPPAPILDDAHQLPVHKGKVDRIADHALGAKNSLTDWFELRIALLKREVKDEIQTVKRQVTVMAKAYGAVAVLGLVAALVGLLVLGFLFSALWGLLLGDEHELWSLTLGFFTLMVVFGIGAAVAYKKAEEKKKTLPLFGTSPPSVDAPPPAPTR